MADRPHRDAERILGDHLRALEGLDIGGDPFGYTMPDEATERAYDVARFYYWRVVNPNPDPDPYGDLWD